MAFDDWSTNPASNTLVGAINWTEGQLPGTVNGSARQMMADLATWRDTIVQALATIEANRVPIGTEFLWGGTTAPTGYLLLYGQAVSRTTYATLFGVYSTTYGPGDGSTTFNVPDYRGRSPFGKDDMGGASAGRLAIQIDGDALGAVGGAEQVTLTTAQLAAHSHGITDTGHAHMYHDSPNYAGTQPGGNLGFARDTQSINTGSATTGITVNNAGGGDPHSNLPPAIIRNFIVRAL